jgi:hypothetical protein
MQACKRELRSFPKQWPKEIETAKSLYPFVLDLSAHVGIQNHGEVSRREVLDYPRNPLRCRLEESYVFVPSDGDPSVQIDTTKRNSSRNPQPFAHGREELSDVGRKMRDI